MPKVSEMLDEILLQTTKKYSWRFGRHYWWYGAIVPDQRRLAAMQLKMDQVLFLGGKLINGIALWIAIAVCNV
jgi:hypothetical protein